MLDASQSSSSDEEEEQQPQRRSTRQRFSNDELCGGSSHDIENYFAEGSRVEVLIQSTATSPAYWQPSSILRIESNTSYNSWKNNSLWKPEHATIQMTSFVLTARYEGEDSDRLVSWNGSNSDPLPHVFKRYLLRKDKNADITQVHSSCPASPLNRLSTGVIHGNF